jgi:catechol 2,3-dioxygenase-like lactoylglutathione lyase family enzyme
MSGRLRLAPALLVAALGVALVLHMSPSRAGSAVNPSPTRAVGGVAIPVADMERSIAFYSTLLFFEKVSDVETAGFEIARLFGTNGGLIRVVTMRLGADQIELVEYGGRRAGPAHAPDGARSPEHIAIVVNDLDQALLWLRRNHVAQSAPEPDRAPSAGGVRTVSIEDPDGHALEILQFQAGKGDARWQRPTDRVFLGIDHAAIVVGDTETSLRFYRDLLGLRVVGGSESTGTEPEILNDGPDGRPRVTTLRAAKGPAIQLLEYREPRDAKRSPREAGDARVGWRTVLITADASAAAGKLGNASGGARPAVVSLADAPLGFRRGFAAEDPDGHELQLRSR